MPIYAFQCVDCGDRDQRLVGCDDYISICSCCGGLMLRLNEDVFWPYFKEVSSQHSASETLTQH